MAKKYEKKKPSIYENSTVLLKFSSDIFTIALEFHQIYYEQKQS